MTLLVCDIFCVNTVWSGDLLTGHNVIFDILKRPAFLEYKVYFESFNSILIGGRSRFAPAMRYLCIRVWARISLVMENVAAKAA